MVVEISNDVSVYKNPKEIDYKTGRAYDKELVLLIKKPNNVFVGKSPKNRMTIFSGGYGSKFIGNTILVDVKNNEYVFISNIIYKFKQRVLY